MPAFWNLRLGRRALPGCQPASVDPGARAPMAQPVQILELDARTEWPTHRIRSFLSMRETQRHAPTGR